MAIKIELKRSAVPGKVPSTSSLDLGEVAINTFDGKAYFKKNDGTQKIVQLADVSGSIASASFATTASYALFAANGGGATNQISTGSIIASVDVSPNNLFLIKSGSNVYFNISSSSNTTLSSDLFIIKNFTTQQPVLTISQSVVQFATQSIEPTGTIQAGSIWFTSSSFYVGLE
jgi:hypothetical protein